jgi:hypothetical protein
METMGSSRNNAKRPMTVDKQGLTPESSAVEESVQAIKRWESAILPALFMLASQNRLSRQADKRSHLNLQIDLLAEREMTAVLQLLQNVASHLRVDRSVTPEQLRDLMKRTDLKRLEAHGVRPTRCSRF